MAWRAQQQLAGAELTADIASVGVGQPEIKADHVVGSALESLARLRAVEAVSMA